MGGFLGLHTGSSRKAGTHLVHLFTCWRAWFLRWYFPRASGPDLTEPRTPRGTFGPPVRTPG